MEEVKELEKVQPQKDHGGVWVEIGGKNYKVPPLNFKALRELAGQLDAIQKIGSAPSLDQVDAMVKVIHRAVVRNYPDMSEDEFIEMLDLGNARPILLAIMSVPGLKERPRGSGE